MLLWTSMDRHSVVIPDFFDELKAKMAEAGQEPRWADFPLTFL